MNHGAIEFDVVGVAQPQGSKTTGVGRAGKRFVRESNKSLPGWRQLVMTEAQRHAPDQPLEGPVSLRIHVWLPLPKSAPKTRRIWPTTKPDSSKLLRAIEDALEGVFYRQDAQNVFVSLCKRYAYEGPPRAHIAIWPTQEEP